MVKIRLKRMGSKYNAFYRIVAADARAPRDGKYIEEIGFYNPHTKEIRINEEIKNKWLGEGAQPSETVKRLFTKAAKAGSNGQVVVLPKKEKKVKETAPVVEEAAAVEVTEAPAEEVQVEATEETTEEVVTEEVKTEA